MKSLYNFIIKPLTNRYDNIRKVGDKTLIINTTIENHRFVSKQAVVVSVPAAYSSHIKIGDNIYVHHNIFRRWYDQKGKERNSSMYFKDDLYFCTPDQIYMYNNKPHGPYCFVKPIPASESYIFKPFAEEPLMGKIRYINTRLKSYGLDQGDLVTFQPDTEYEFEVDGEKLYRMFDHHITVAL